MRTACGKGSSAGKLQTDSSSIPPTATPRRSPTTPSSAPCSPSLYRRRTRSRVCEPPVEKGPRLANYRRTLHRFPRRRRHADHLPRQVLRHARPRSIEGERDQEYANRLWKRVLGWQTTDGLFIDSPDGDATPITYHAKFCAMLALAL